MKNHHRRHRFSNEYSTVGPHYDDVERWCNDVVSSGKDLMFDPVSYQKEVYKISRKFQFPSLALVSFLRNISLVHVKKTAPVVKRSLPNYLHQYKDGTSIIDLAKTANYPPYLFARYIVEAVTNFKHGKKAIAEAMRNPETELGDIQIIDPAYLVSEKSRSNVETKSSLENADRLKEQSITVTRLAKEVKEAISSDPMYGPMHDRERHVIGIEYEVVLEKGLTAMDIPFETEAQLRDKGTSRTPDILLSVPLGIEVPKRDGSGEKEWKLVGWIDSKAMFGDEVTHRTSVLPQAESYVHRFGPGLILYWFGHAPIHRLGDAHGDITIVAWEIPNNFIWPTGEYVTASSQK